MKNYDQPKKVNILCILMPVIYTVGQKLSTGNQKWENPSLFTKEYINNLDEFGQSGSILEADLEYPNHYKNTTI